jgi:hypothetical protein
MSLSFERGSDGWCQRERDAGSSYDVMSGRSILGSLAKERGFGSKPSHLTSFTDNLSLLLTKGDVGERPDWTHAGPNGGRYLAHSLTSVTGRAEVRA